MAELAYWWDREKSCRVQKEYKRPLSASQVQWIYRTSHVSARGWYMYVL